MTHYILFINGSGFREVTKLDAIFYLDKYTVDNWEHLEKLISEIGTGVLYVTPELRQEIHKTYHIRGLL